MDSVTLLRRQLEMAHENMEATMADVTQEQADWMPPGVATPLGASYAHVVTAEDMVVNGMLRGQAPLYATEWAGRTGASEPMPTPGPEWTGYARWNRSVRVDIPAARQYAQAVYASTAAYLDTLSPEALGESLDLTSAGMGHMPRGIAFSLLVLEHISTLMGEISCLKGLQGARGYPF